ncbi:unnamed protein product [Malus baccata var. baccata]
MIRAADSSAFKAVNHQLNFPEAIGKFMFPRAHETVNENKGVSSILVDTSATVEDDNTLVVRSNGQRKRNDGEEEGCKYIRLERKAVQKLLRKLRLPGNANVAAITAKCENGVLTLVVEKLPPPPNPKPVEVSIS